MKNRELILDLWSAPAPTAGFADRVMVACAPPMIRRKPSEGRIRSSRNRQAARHGLAAAPRLAPLGSRIFAVAALVAATVLVPLFVSHSAAPPQAIAVAPLSVDLGPQQD